MLISQFFMTQTLNYTNFKTLTNKTFFKALENFPGNCFSKVIWWTLNKFFLFGKVLPFLSITLNAENVAQRKYHVSCAKLCTTFHMHNIFLRDIFCVLCIQFILLQPQHGISGEDLYYRKQSFIPRSQGEKGGLPLPNLNKFNLL